MKRIGLTWMFAAAAMAGGWSMPSAAAGGTLTVSWEAEPWDDGHYDVPTLRFRASPGERNRVRVVGSERGVTVADAEPVRVIVRQRAKGPRLPRCHSVTVRRVRCPAAAASGSNHFDLGDEDDRFDGSGPNLLLLDARGQEGDDILRGGRILFGGSGRDRLSGGPYGSQLKGGAGRDHLRGGAGSDELCGDCRAPRASRPTLPARPARDVIDGRAGVDSVEVSGRDGIHVDLSSPDLDGDVRAPDVLRGVENVYAWSPRDMVLIGDDEPNVLYADGTGRDHLDGRGGDDAIYAGQGDRLSGGDGGDQLFADVDSRRPKGAHRVTYMSGGDGEDYVPVPPSGSSVVDCGSGDDATTVAPRASAAAAPSCEFYAGHEGLADPLWLGRAARVIGDTIQVTLRWRRREPLAFTAKMTGQASDLFVVLAEATGHLEPGDSVVQMPFTEAGRKHGGWTSEPHGLAVHHPGQGAGQPFGGTLPSGAVTAGGP